MLRAQVMGRITSEPFLKNDYLKFDVVDSISHQIVQVSCRGAIKEAVQEKCCMGILIGASGHIRIRIHNEIPKICMLANQVELIKGE